MEWMNASLLPSIRTEMDDTFKMFVVCTYGTRITGDKVFVAYCII